MEVNPRLNTHSTGACKLSNVTLAGLRETLQHLGDLIY